MIWVDSQFICLMLSGSWLNISLSPATAVHHYVCSSVLLSNKEGVPFNRLSQFSDGAPTQYKNRIGPCDG